MFKKQFEQEYPKVTIVILNWNNWSDTVDCLESVYDINYPNFEIVVVDNGSTDNSVREIKSRFDSLTLLEAHENLGFSKGVNYGIKFAMNNNAEYVFLLNNDTIVDKNVLTELVGRISKDQKVGLVGGKIYFLNEKDKIWSAGGGIKPFSKRTYHFGENQFDNREYDSEREVDFLSGCCLLIRKEVIREIGLFDTDYFMYYEDADFCLRTKELFKVIYYPQAKIWHKVGNASRKSNIDYYRMKNHFLFLEKRYFNNKFIIKIIGLFIFVERVMRIFLREVVFHDSEKISNRMSALIKGFKVG
ncbi:MAG: glycosyltransferase family 2 protein, partial [Candidatus Scalindua sp.]